MTNPEDRFAPPSSAHGADDEPTVPRPVVPHSATGAVGGAGAAGGVPVPNTGGGPSGGSSVRTAVLSVAATLVAIGVVAGAFFLGRAGDPTPTTTESTTTTDETTTTTTPETTTTVEPVEPAPEPPPAPIGDVRAAPAGLLCKDLAAQGYSYSAAVDYWRLHGQPNRMDADKNGIPCETVYSRSDVVAYWPSSTYGASVSYGLPSGLLCRDLQARGVGVYDALRYYIWEGFPSRMDADGNGIPCETVYPDAAAIWLWEF